VLAVLAEAGRADLPVVANVDYGHTSPAGVLPLGCGARVDPVPRTVNVVDAGVRRA
jgi:muramoyltetrapeptide carboxypeptidase LdcA involved in peptidoglycan recycling